METLFSLLTTIVSLGAGVFAIIILFMSMWKLYEKAVYERWKSLVPFLCGATRYKMCGYSGYLRF